MNEPAPTYRVDAKTVKGDLPVLLLLVLDVGYGLTSLPKMPDRVPTHWGLSGQPNAYGPAWMNAILFPAIALAAYLSLLYLPLIDPRRRNYALFPDTARFIRCVLVLFMVGFHVVIVRASLGASVAMDFIARLGVALLIMALGNRMGRLRQNFFFGIRVPWTIMSEDVWNRTHRLAGRLWVGGGLVLVAIAFLPAKSGTIAMVAVLSALVMVPVVYSWRLYERLHGERADDV